MSNQNVTENINTIMYFNIKPMGFWHGFILINTNTTHIKKQNKSKLLWKKIKRKKISRFLLYDYLTVYLYNKLMSSNGQCDLNFSFVYVQNAQTLIYNAVWARPLYAKKRLDLLPGASRPGSSRCSTSARYTRDSLSLSSNTTDSTC